MAADDALDRALLVALALADERDLALLRRRALDEPDAPPELTPEISAPLRARLVLLRAEEACAAERRRCELLGLALVPWDAADYPAALLDLSAPPPVLWLRGEGTWPPPQPITIVGARSSTARGRAFASELGAGVVERGGSVVSGLAIGIDQASHEGALAADGAAFAILACGVDQIYPPGAKPLAERVERTGRIVSEMPLGTPPYKNHFPRRNRLLAALSQATIVVEADVMSGSLSTARRALELGRSVHAVPGPIDAPTSRGTNRLIRDGAHPLLAVEDLELLVDASRGGKAAAGLRAKGEALLQALAAPAAVDELARKLDVAVDRLLVRLVELEADGRVARLGGGLYVRTA
jgi:DNA processing protein